VGNENAIKMWDFKSGDLMHTLTFPAGMEAVEFSSEEITFFAEVEVKLKIQEITRRIYLCLLYS
jgi:hypothetical protein